MCVCIKEKGGTKRENKKTMDTNLLSIRESGRRALRVRDKVSERIHGTG